MKDLLQQVGFLWLRILMGFGIATHGYAKIFAPGELKHFSESVAGMGFIFPFFFSWAAALSEFAGAILIILGLGTRFAASFILTTMAVAFFVYHKLDPFKVKELAFLYGTVAATLVMTGAGRLSLDHFFTNKKG